MELIWKDGKIDYSLDTGHVQTVLRASLEENYGAVALGLALTSLQVKYFDATTNLLIIRCNRSQVEQVWCSATLITQIDNRTVMARLVHLAGTLRCCQEAAVSFHRAASERLPPSLRHRADPNAEAAIMALSR